MIIKRSLIIVSFITLLCAPAWGLTLQEAQEEALRNSEAARIGQYQTEALRQSATQNSYSVKPQVIVSAQTLKMGTNAADNPFIPYPEAEISTTIEGSQLLWAGGRVFKNLSLERNIKSQATLFAASYKRDIRKQIRDVYYAAMFRKSMLQILTDRVEQRQRELGDATNLRDAGMVTSLDVRQGQLNLNLAITALLEGETNYSDSLITLNLALGRAVDTKTLPEPDGTLQKADDLPAKVLELHEAVTLNKVLTLKQAKAQTQTARLSYEIATTSRMPELSVVGSATSSGEDTAQMNQQWAAGLQLSIPILDGGLIRATKSKARAEHLEAKEQLAQTHKALLAQAIRLGVRAQSIEESITLKEENLELAARNYEDARELYRVGTITITRLEAFNLAYAETRFQLMQQYWQQQNLMSNIVYLLE
jgi:outer membrane protein